MPIWAIVKIRVVERLRPSLHRFGTEGTSKQPVPLPAVDFVDEISTKSTAGNRIDRFDVPEVANRSTKLPQVEPCHLTNSTSILIEFKSGPL